MSERWTEDDDIYLEYFIFSKDSKLDVAADFLGRSLNATIKRASLLRKKRHDYYICSEWTLDEDEYIKMNYKTVTYKNIGLRLNRSCKSVSERTRKLGLRKNQSLVAIDKKIRDLAEAGMYPADIARSLKIDYETLRDYLKRHGIKYEVMSRDESLKRAREKSPFNKYKFTW